MSNPLIINETIDLREHCERRLPTERLYHERTKASPSKYKLRALIRYHSGHFFTYALTPNDEGILHWARFDDLLERVLWENPIPSVPLKASQGHDFMLFYERVDPKTGAFLAADKKGVFKPAGVRQVKAGKPVAFSSGNITSSRVDKQKDVSVDEDEKEKKEKKNGPVAGKVSAHGGDQAVLYADINYFTFCIPKMQAQLKGLEFWLHNHHVPYRKEESAGISDATRANLVIGSSEMKAQLKDLEAKAEYPRTLFRDNEKPTVTVGSALTYDWPSWFMYQFHGVHVTKPGTKKSRNIKLPYWPDYEVGT
jgi:hypothetical protein